MRDLARADVVKSAAIASLVGTLACYPRIALWPKPPAPIWYLMTLLLLGGFVLWAFVFAWHARYTNRPVFTFKFKTVPCLIATGGGMVGMISLHVFVDPRLRGLVPEDYPVGLDHWFATTLFSLAFSQLLLVFAPFDWSLRLFKHPGVAIFFTTLFGVLVLALRPMDLPPGLFGAVLLLRAATSLIAVWLYCRHGAVLAWWWGLLLHARYLLEGGS